jgi:enoyl-CoA hydratase/carnithine racemase
MYKDFIKIMHESANNDAVTVVVVTGNGDFYSSGNDFISYATNEDNDIDKSMDVVRYAIIF